MMKELKFDDLQKINGGIGGSSVPYPKHVRKTAKKRAKCLGGVLFGAMAGKGSWQNMAWGALSGSLNCF